MLEQERYNTQSASTINNGQGQLAYYQIITDTKKYHDMVFASLLTIIKPRRAYLERIKGKIF